MPFNNMWKMAGDPMESGLLGVAPKPVMSAAQPIAQPVQTAPPVQTVAQPAVQSSTNPFALNYNDFIKAVSPYMNATSAATDYKPGYWDNSNEHNEVYVPASGLSNYWASPEGQNGSVALKLADGRTWTPSGASSGIMFHPAGEKTYTDALPQSSSERDENVPQTVEVNPTDYWTISGDMSQLLGASDTNQHKSIRYEKVGDQLVPVNTNDWQYSNHGIVGDQLRNPLVQTGLLAMLTMGAGSALAGAGEANAFGNAGMTAADIAEMGGSTATQAAYEAQLAAGGGLLGDSAALPLNEVASLPSATSETGLLSTPTSSGIDAIGSSTAPNSFATATSAAPSAEQLAAAAGGSGDLTAAQIAQITGGVGDATGAGVSSGLLSGLSPESTAPNAFGSAAPTTEQLASAVGTGTGATMSNSFISALPDWLQPVAQAAIDHPNVAGAALGALAGSQDSTVSSTASKTPWAEAAPWMKANLAAGQALQQQYAANPFNDQQKAAYQNLFNGVDNFNQNTMPALTAFANNGMNSSYQRQRGGAVGSGGGYGGAVQPGGLLASNVNQLRAPSMGALGQIDWSKIIKG